MSSLLQNIRHEKEKIETCLETCDFLTDEEKAEGLTHEFWNSEFSFAPRKPFSKNVVSVWEDGVYKSTVQIIFCGLDREEWEFDKITDPIVLFNAIECFVEKIGVLPSFPIRTTQKLFEKTVKREIPVLSENPIEYFEPFLERRDDTLIFLRDLEATERRAEKLFAFDKRSMFLNVCSSLEFGENEYLKIDGLPEYEKIFETISFSSNPVKLPTGLFEVESIRFPKKINQAFWFSYFAPVIANRFYYNSLIDLFLEAGAEIKIKSGYVWTETHRTFERLYKVVSTAKKETTGSEMLSVQAANGAIKSLYTDFFGFLRKRENAGSDYAKKWFRPDWRGLIISQAVADLLRNAWSVQQKTGKKPFAVLHDCLMYAGNDRAEFAGTVLEDSNRFSFEWELDRAEAFDDTGKAVLKLAEIDKRGKGK